MCLPISLGNTHLKDAAQTFLVVPSYRSHNTFYLSAFYYCHSFCQLVCIFTKVEETMSKY